MIHDAIYVGIGFVICAFTPSVGRKIKSWFVKESPKVESDVKAEAKKL